MLKNIARFLVLALALPCLPAQAQVVYPGSVAIVTTAVNVNAAATDVALVSIPYAKYIVRRVTLFEASTSLGASAATIGVFTATGGGGTTVVTLATMVALTAATKRTDSTLALTTDYIAASQLVIRCGTAHGSAATISVLIEVQPVG